MGKSSSYKKKRSKNSSQVFYSSLALSIHVYTCVCVGVFCSPFMLLNCKKSNPLFGLRENFGEKNSKLEVLELMILCLLGTHKY